MGKIRLNINRWAFCHFSNRCINLVSLSRLIHGGTRNKLLLDSLIRLGQWKGIVLEDVFKHRLTDNNKTPPSVGGWNVNVACRTLDLILQLRELSLCC